MTDDRAREVLDSHRPGWCAGRPSVGVCYADAIAAMQDYAAECEAAVAADMPTIWEDPAGKGYPCFERPMTAREARKALADADRRIIAAHDEGYAAGVEAAAKVADSEADDIEAHAHLRRDQWQAGRQAMARTIAAAIRQLATTRGEG